MLEDRDRALEVRATEQHFAQQGKAGAVRPVDLDHAEQLALCLFPLVERGVGACKQHAALEVIGGRIEAHARDLDGVAWATEGQIGLT